MKSARDNFHGVQKALNLKRHEHPPSNFFDRFSDKVIDRISAGPPAGPKAWYERLGFGENWKLGLLCLLGVFVCAALATGWLAAPKVPPAEEPPGGPQDDPAAAIYNPPSHPSDIIAPGFQHVPGADDTPDSTKPVMVPSSISGEDHRQSPLNGQTPKPASPK